MGRNVAIGTNVVLRHPGKIFIGDSVVIDDNCCLDAKGTTNGGITLGTGVFIGRNTMLSCKNGDITLEEGANIGINVGIMSSAQVRVGARALIAAYTYLVGGDHLHDRVDIPVLHQGRTAQGIDVGDNAWLGAHVVVTDGARIGRDAIVGAGAIVNGTCRTSISRRACPRPGSRIQRDVGTLNQAALTLADGGCVRRARMCGIVGIVEPELGRPIPAAEVQRMVRTLNHRGPDEEGSVQLPGVALAMRRLSIVDLAGGQQPFSNEDGTIQVVANGEIYNFAEIRRELERKGHAFHSRSDIEVLVHAYEEYGEAFLGRLRGMFALALWDGRKRTLLAARDRAGEKPLYYAQTPSGLLLGSEIKALLSRAEVSREVDLEAIDQFLTYEYIIAPRTIFKHIRKLPAAHYLLYRDGDVQVRRYWDAADVPAAYLVGDRGA